MIYVTSDLHGYSYEKFMGFLDSSGFSEDDHLFVLGDVIDRGDDGIRLLKWLMGKRNTTLILGNHEVMMMGCTFIFDEVREDNLSSLTADKLAALYDWERNGGDVTIKALKAEGEDGREAIFDYLMNCPLYERVSAGGSEFVLVHSGLGNYSPEREIEDYELYELLQTRPYLTDRYSEDFLTVIGHTPTGYYSCEYRGRMLRTDTWVDIDTGAAGGLAPMLLRLDDMKEFYIE